MTVESKDLLQEEATHPAVERRATRKMYIPKADIYETQDAILLLMDVPGVDEKSLDITLEKDVLTIHGTVEPEPMTGYTLSDSEYAVGEYYRAFTLSAEVDREKISASCKNGVLRLTLPKAEAAKTRKITVHAEA